MSAESNAALSNSSNDQMPFGASVAQASRAIALTIEERLLELAEVKLKRVKIEHRRLSAHLAKLEAVRTATAVQPVLIRGSAAKAVQSNAQGPSDSDTPYLSRGDSLQPTAKRACLRLGIGAKPYNVLCDEMGRWSCIMGYQQIGNWTNLDA